MAKQQKEIIVPDGILAERIYRLRDENVMLDRDLADLYGVKAIRLREQVRRNIEKFPSHFMFQLNDAEVDIMVSQNAIPSRQYLGGALPYAFTEHGVLMLSNVLKSDLAIKMSIKLIEIFVQLRKSLNTYTELSLEIERIKKKLNNQDKNIELVFQYLDELVEKKESPASTERTQIGYVLGKENQN